MENINVNNGKYGLITKGYFYFGIIAIFAMICINVFSSFEIPAVSFLLVFLIVAFFCDRTELFALIACCVPFSVSFQYKFGILICLAVYLIKYFKDIKFRWPVIISFGCLAAWELLHVIIGGESIYEYLRDFCALILCAFVALTSLKKVDYIFIIRVLAYACLGIMTVLFIEQLRQNDFVFDEIFRGNFRFGWNKEEEKGSLFALVFNPNTLGFICNFCIVGLVQLIISKRANVFDYLLIVPFVLFGVMTMSRAFLLCFACIVLMFLISGKLSVKKKLIRAGFVMAIVLGIVLLVTIIMPNVIERLLGRFEVDDVSNGRFELLVFYTKHIFASFKNATFGIGLQGIADKLRALYPDAYDVCHNGIQEIVIAWGFPGLIGFVAFMYFVLRRQFTKKRFSFVSFMPIILLFVNIQLGQFLSAGLTLLMFAFSIMSAKYKFYKEQEVCETSSEQVIENETEGSFISKLLKNPSRIVAFIGKTFIGRLISDKLYLKILYYAEFKTKLNLDEPKTFNEKLQWLKLNNRKGIYTVMVDKYEVKDLIIEKLGEDYVIPTIGVWDNANDIDFDALPEKFVLKCNHNSGEVIICKDKSKLNVKETVEKLNACLKQNDYFSLREWPYKNVLPKIIAEKFIKDKNNEFLAEYKVMCFNGEPKIIQAIKNVNKPNETIDYFDVNWKLLELKQNYPNSEEPFEKPDCLEEMLSLSKKLAKNQPFIKVCWNVVNGKLKFSGFNFYSDAGFAKFAPADWDEKLGGYINIEKIKGRVSNAK